MVLIQTSGVNFYHQETQAETDGLGLLLGLHDSLNIQQFQVTNCKQRGTHTNSNRNSNLFRRRIKKTLSSIFTLIAVTELCMYLPSLIPLEVPEILQRLYFDNLDAYSVLEFSSIFILTFPDSFNLASLTVPEKLHLRHFDNLDAYSFVELHLTSASALLAVLD